MKMYRSVFRILVLVGLGALLLTACSSGGGDPAEVTKAWFEALVNGDGQAMAGYSCQSQRGSVDATSDLLSAMSSLGGEGLGLGAEIDISNLQYSVASQSDDRARVRVTGKMGLTILGIYQEDTIDTSANLVLESGQWKVC